MYVPSTTTYMHENVRPSARVHAAMPDRKDITLSEKRRARIHTHTHARTHARTHAEQRSTNEISKQKFMRPSRICLDSHIYLQNTVVYS